jgi:hypothetical protein
VRWFAARSGAADAGEDRADHLFAQGEQGGDGAGGFGGQVVAAGPAGFDDQVFAAQLAQVVGRLTGGVVGAGLRGSRVAVRFRGRPAVDIFGLALTEQCRVPVDLFHSVTARTPAVAQTDISQPEREDTLPGAAAV